jgi:Winged helix DNA-binding domain
MTPSRPSVPPLRASRAQILAYRRRVGALDERLPWGPESLRRVAWAGLQDSMPRAALLSIHARVEDAGHDAWEDPSLIQVWGPRYGVYVVHADDLAVFTLGRLPGHSKRRFAEELTVRLEELLAGSRMRYDDAGVALGTHGNNLRYAALTGRLAIRWEGARRPLVWMVPPPQIDEAEAARELARRYLRVFGPATAEGFAKWGSVGARQADAVFDELAAELVPVRTPIGAAWLLAEDEQALREASARDAPARLLPSGDTYTLGVTLEERALLVPDAAQRAELWTPRVWPGAVLAGGKIVGTWRRAGRTLAVQTWQKLTPATRDAIVAEAEALPLPDEGQTVVQFDGG